MNDQANKAEIFRKLHERSQPLLLPNPWDVGTARLLAGLGFEALATTSLGVANSQGRSRARASDLLDNCKAISEATTLPLSVDLENCYADAPAEAAQMIKSAFEHGAVGASIEDATGDPRAPIYDFNLAVERVQAASTTVVRKSECRRSLCPGAPHSRRDPDRGFIGYASGQRCHGPRRSFNHARPARGSWSPANQHWGCFLEAGAASLHASCYRDAQWELRLCRRNGRNRRASARLRTRRAMKADRE